MPYVQLPPIEIEIPIPDIQIGQTVIKRKAKLFSLIYNKGSKEVAITWTVQHYAATADGIGEYLSFIPDWSVTSVADNTTMCDVSNGFPIGMIEVGKDDDGDPVFDYDPKINYTGQYDFFCQLAQNKPVLIHAMIIQFGQKVKSWEKR
jgi:hypothetical protein